MIVGYFLKRFFAAFFIFIISLSLIFACGDVLVRLAALPSFFSLPHIFALMFPLMTLCSFLLASSLAVQYVVGSLFVENEILFFQFFSRARRSLHLIVLLFSITLACVYVPLVFNWAPASYWKAKHYILNSIKEQFEYLAPEQFHRITPRFTFYFKSKKTEGSQTIFKNIILSVKESEKAHYFVTAQKCSIIGSQLVIRYGSVQTKSQSTWYSGTFERTNIDLNEFLQDEKNKQRPVKFYTLKELLSKKKSDPKTFVEFHKRLAQVLWQLLFPLLALWGMLIVGQRHSTLLASLLVSGGLFLYSYIGLSLAQAFAKDLFVSLLCLYGCSSLAFILFFILYKRRW